MCCVCWLFVFFFKQKTAYEMRISDWSSDVCSSDLIRQRSTLRAFRQSVFTNTLAGDHEFAHGWKLSWLANYTQSKDDRLVVGEVTWDIPSTRNLWPTVSYDFSHPNLSILNHYSTMQRT